ncbi:hypothetical protein [Halococcus sp. IIIV-5B]|uniref:hypothetical protein n=1 Tax=Halococcus sp. IIIV-5B TaxID=2321230 RepID=UPI000E76C7A7|nr:hypothetical protein [Halococcus sp. IIIV-5B]RJT07937.1 hypothetical protein D3261_00890 [Halococcus sp. IIIV-5B]
MPQLYLQSGMMALGGLLLGLLGVLFLMDGEDYWWTIALMGGFNVFGGAGMYYEYDPAECSIGNRWLALAFGALVFEIALFVFVVLSLV